MSNKALLNRDSRGAGTDTACDAGKGNDMTKPEFIPKLREIQSLVIPQIKQALGPLFFATSLEKKKGNVIDNGSFAYVGTHQKNLLVTCHHVWNGFLEERAKRPGLKLCGCFDDRTPVPFCTLPDGTENKPIDQDKQLDIATFDMKPFEHYVRGKNFFFPNHIPESIVNQNDAVAIIGCPGILRRRRSILRRGRRLKTTSTAVPGMFEKGEFLIHKRLEVSILSDRGVHLLGLKNEFICGFALAPQLAEVDGNVTQRRNPIQWGRQRLDMLQSPTKAGKP